MDPFSLTVGAATMADMCIKYGFLCLYSCAGTSRVITFTCRYGISLIAKYRSYQTAEHDILELILRVEHHWLKTECQVEFLRSVWSDLGEHLQVHQNNILRVLYLKINETTLLIDQVIGNK